MLGKLWPEYLLKIFSFFKIHSYRYSLLLDTVKRLETRLARFSMFEILRPDWEETIVGFNKYHFNHFWKVGHGPLPCSAPKDHCFASGDNRTNVLPGLTLYHTLWHRWDWFCSKLVMISIMMIMMLIILAREHNRVAAELAKMHPAWNDDKLYSEVMHMLHIVAIGVIYLTFQHLEVQRYISCWFPSEFPAIQNLLCNICSSGSCSCHRRDATHHLQVSWNCHHCHHGQWSSAHDHHDE